MSVAEARCPSDVCVSILDTSAGIKTQGNRDSSFCGHRPLTEALVAYAAHPLARASLLSPKPASPRSSSLLIASGSQSSTPLPLPE
jgi:hypothetical protein